MTAPCGKTVKTTCPYCGVGCGVLATPKPDGAVEIAGDPDHPANFGRLCSKGSALGETTGLNGRLLEPEIHGHRADWDTALDLVADKFSRSIEEHGPDSVAFYVSGQILTEDYYVANKLMKGFIGSANIDTNSRLCMASSVAGHRKAFGTDTVPGAYADLELADLIVLVGSNLAWCHPVLYQRIEAAKARRPEMKVVLIDPRRTTTASLADLHLAINPDGDAALFTGLLAYLAEKGRLDEAYISQHTNGFESALETASQVTEMELLRQTGLPKAEIDRFYDLFARTEKAVTVYSQGVNQSRSGTDKVSTILNCHLATGRIGKPGMGPFSVTGQPNAMGGREVGGLANMLACHMNLEDSAHRDTVQTFWNAPAIPEAAGLKAIDMFDAVADGRIKALWIMSTNPVDSLPEASKVEKALQNCPFVVVSDILEETDTIRYAHVKLPSSAWGEKDGTVTNSERRISRQRSFLPAPGNTKADWWQMAEVGKRMGFADAFAYDSSSEIFEEYAHLSAYQNEGSRDFDIGGMIDVTEDEYDGLEPFQWPLKRGEQRKESRFFANGNFYWPDKKARFVAVTPKVETVTSAEKPFVLNTGRVRDHWHTMTRTARSARLSSHIAEPYCEIHPHDAGKLGIERASLVKLSNENGSIVVRASINDHLKAGTVYVPIHWTDQYASNARVDVLVPAVLDPFSGQPASKNVAVSLEPFVTDHYGFLVMREKPNLRKFGADYWAIAPCEGGWRAEFAFCDKESAKNMLKNFASSADEESNISYEDKTSQQTRLAQFDGAKLHAAVYLSATPVHLARAWLIDQLSINIDGAEDRMRVLAGRPDANLPDKGAIVCSCLGIGTNQIMAVARDGALSVNEIGELTGAGTNCGSCRAELNGMLDAFVKGSRLAAE